MAANDLQINKLTFNTAAFMDVFKNICNIYLDDLSKELKNLVMTEIYINGNGSHDHMRMSAATSVKETKREITDDRIALEVGIDLDELKQRSEEIFVRVSVVLHGNLAGESRTWRDPGRLWTKPGQQTYKKHVRNKSMSRAKSLYMLPAEFVQDDKMVNIVGHVSDNVEKEANKYVGVFLQGLNGALKSLNWAAFIEVG